MPFFNIVVETNENTVVTEYEPVKSRSDNYQSEAELEQEFIKMLMEQGYEYLKIHSEADMIANLKMQLEILNDYTFSDSEWERFFNDCIANKNEHIVEKTRKIQEDNIQVLKRDDNLSKNIMLIDMKNIHNNCLQVINQYVLGKEDGANYDNRYDVTVLVKSIKSGIILLLASAQNDVNSKLLLVFPFLLPLDALKSLMALNLVLLE